MNKRLGIVLMLALVLVLVLGIFGAMTLRGNGDEGETTAASAQALSLEDFYPSLNSSYGGYPVPTPDGSLRLSSLKRNPDSPSMLVVKTDFLYDEEGRLAGTKSYFDAEASYQYLKLFFGWDPDSCLIEADAQGRASKVTVYPGQEDEYVTEFTYPDYRAEQQSFHAKTVYADGTVHERDENVDDYLAQNEITKTQSELSPDSEFEYDEDGLVTRAKMAERTNLEGKPISKNYFYQYVADNNGFLEYVYGEGRISFNRHGYLTEYPLVPAGACYYEYYYVPAA